MLLVPLPSQRSAHRWPRPPGGVSPAAYSAPRDTRSLSSAPPPHLNLLTEGTGVSVRNKIRGERPDDNEADSRKSAGMEMVKDSDR